MVPKWYVRNDDEELGPFAAGELKQLVKSGELLATDMVQREGTEKWQPASSLKGLFPVPAAKSTSDKPDPPRPAQTSSSRGGRVVLVAAVLMALLGVAGAGWFFMQSQDLQDQLRLTEEKLRLQSVNKSPPVKENKDSETLPMPKPAPDEQILAQLQRFKDKEKKDALALDELRKSVAALQTKSKQDALALGGLQAGLRDFQADFQQRFDKLVKERLAELDSTAKLQEETLVALRKEAGLAEADALPVALIDKYALAAGPDVEKSLEGLARYLTAPFKTDKDKVRSIYRWMTDRIMYDVPTLLSKDPFKQSAADVLQSRKAVCMGYANLFEKLCRLNDIECSVINGDAPDSPTATSPHSWNAVKIEGKWLHMDVTWAAGNVKNKEFHKKLNDTYFLPSPEVMVLAHLPNEAKWQLLDAPLPEKEVRMLFALPRQLLMKTLQAGASDKALLQQALKNEAFRANLQRVNNNQIATLEKLGLLSGQHLLDTISQEKFPGLVTASFPPGLDTLQVRKAPITKELAAGTMLDVELTGVGQAAIILNGKFFHMTSKGNLFTGSVMLEPGDVKVAVLPEGQSNPFRHILTYVVPDNGTKTPVEK